MIVGGLSGGRATEPSLRWSPPASTPSPAAAVVAGVAQWRRSWEVSRGGRSTTRSETVATMWAAIRALHSDLPILCIQLSPKVPEMQAV